MISTPARRCEPSFILNTFQPLRCKLAHGVPFASMRPNQPRGSIIGRNRRRDTRTRTRHTCIRACVRGWQGSGPDSAPAKSHSLSLSLHFSPSIYPPLSFPSFFLSLCFSLSLSLAPSLFPRPRQRVTLLLFRRYLDWLAFQRTTLFPATAEIPGRSFIAAQLYRPRENFIFPTNGYEHASRVFRKLGFHESPAGQLAVRRVLRRNRFAGMRSGSGDGGGR